MSLLDWLNDTGVFGGGANTSGTPMQPGPGAQVGDVNPMGDPTGTMSPWQPGPSRATGPMPPVQMTGQDAPLPQGEDPMNPTPGAYPMGGDPMTADATAAPGKGPLPMGEDPMNPTPTAPPTAAPGTPLPQPRPAGASMQPPVPAAAAGAPMSLAPAAPGPSAPAGAPGQTWLGRAFGITPDQAGLAGREVTGGLAAGLKAIGQGAGVGQGKFAAFAGGMGNAMEGAQKTKAASDKQMTDYLKSAIDARKAGDEAGYKRNYLKYLAAKLQADTDKAASKDAVANKNDTPTQLYLSAQRLVQPERNAANKVLQQMQKDGAKPEEIAKKRAELDAGINNTLAGHYANLGLNPQTAAQLGQQPGNNQENPIDAGKLGITKDNIGQKLQPGQYFRNPSDGKVYQYKGPPKGDGKQPSGKTPDKPSNPEPPNPMKPYKTPLDARAEMSDDDSED